MLYTIAIAACEFLHLLIDNEKLLETVRAVGGLFQI